MEEANNRNSSALRKKLLSQQYNSQANAILKPNTNRRTAGANWNTAINNNSSSSNNNTNNNNNDGKSKKSSNTDKPENTNSGQQAENTKTSPQKRKRIPKSDKYVAMDCEMVGIGFNGQDDMLARVSIVNRNGKVLLDKYVKARDDITDYRTAVSGIRPSDLIDAHEFDAVQDEVVQILKNRVLVGHNVRKDLQVLNIKHPFVKIRDTSSYKPLCRLVSNGRTPSLKRLSEAILGIEIQTGEHNSVEDARAAMSIYNRLAHDWELYLQTLGHNPNRRKR